MRAKVAGAFVMGLAVGALALAGALWLSGSLNVPSVLAGGSRTAKGLALPEPAVPPLPPASPVVTPPVETPDLSSTTDGRLAMPLAGIDPAHLTDTFSESRDGRQHGALDIPAPRGTPVMAVAEGNVVKLFTSKQGGLTVYQFDDTNTYSYYYAHLDHYASGLKEGMLLRKGDVLGYVGSTGNASPQAPHLHLAVNKLLPGKKWWEGTPINPLPLLRQP